MTDFRFRLVISRESSLYLMKVRYQNFDRSYRQFREQKIWSRAQRATFWNLARENYLAAYINHNTTRLDGNDISLGRAAGLPIGQDGSIPPSDLSKSELMERANEDMLSNILVWLLDL
jgi:hypothetical protein